MIATRRPRRFLWLLGVLLVVGTAAGASWVLNHAPASATPVKERDRGAPPGADFVIGLGHVDVKHGITPLHPVQPGRVVEVLVEEGDPVWEGLLLLSVDNRVQRTQLIEARAGLKFAEEMVEKVKLLQAQHADSVAAQQAAVDAARFGAKAKAAFVAVQKRLFDAKQMNADQFRAFEAEGAAVNSLVRVEERKLDKLKNVDFTPDLRRARADIEAKRAVVDRAKVALSECDLYAPGDGEILRRSVTVGEVLGREPRQPALQFCPNAPRLIRAEVQQEWASKVKVGQPCLIEDDTRAGLKWTGRVESKSGWYTPRRSKLMEPFQYNDVRTLECLVSVDPGQDARLRIGQRVRVVIRQGGP